MRLIRSSLKHLFYSALILAEPLIEQGFEAAPDKTQLVIVEVGDRQL